MATPQHLLRPPSSFPRWMHVFSRRSVQVALAAWALSVVAVVALGGSALPFDRPLVAGTALAGELINAQVGAAYALVLMAVAYVVTRRRAIPDLAARAPARAVALAETGFMVAYAVVAQFGGLVLGRALGGHPISFHLPGTIYGLSDPITVREAVVWAGYNFAVFVVVPFLLFRRRGYSPEQLNLRSSNRRNDALLVVVILVLDGASQLLFLGGDLFALDVGQFLVAAPLSVLLNLFGTVLPTMIFVYAILLPRFLKLTDSFATTVLLGGLTYAALHLLEAWTVYDSGTDALLSVIFVLFQYVPPGMVKSVLTLRTGNAWVHAVGYHAVFPHGVLDAANTADIFRVR